MLIEGSENSREGKVTKIIEKRNELQPKTHVHLVQGRQSRGVSTESQQQQLFSSIDLGAAKAV